MTTPIAVGQEVFIARSGSWSTSYTLAQVCKISPSGQVTVETPACGFADAKPYRFGKDGHELGTGAHSRRYLAWNVAEIKARKIEEARMRRVADILGKVQQLNRFKDTYGEETARERIAALRAIADEADRALAGEAPVAPAPVPATSTEAA